jgi:O-antigen ligase
MDVSSDYYLEGSPFDRNVFIGLIVIGIVILWQRKPQWGNIIKNNKFIFLYILYLGLSTLWSDYTFISFKRWIKELGHIIMVLIILTEASPPEAIKTMFTRCAYVLIPLSWVFNRYFPEISRIYSIGGGDPQFTGITTNKNALGVICLISAIILFWSLLCRLNLKTVKQTIRDFSTFAVMFILIAWLLANARSATALAGTIIGCMILFILCTQHVRRNTRLINLYAIVSVVALILIHFSFDLMSVATSSLGRDETLTGRTAFWEELITFGTNPLIGTGYESFWLGDRIAYFWDKYWWRPNQAHNGYIELYLNIGFLGLTLLATLIIAAVRNIKKNISSMNSYNYQILRLTFIVIVLAVNVTEAYFKGPVWFVFLVLAMEPPKTLTSGTD